jgi:uncharacterized protein YbaR (Trm112 family)
MVLTRILLVFSTIYYFADRNTALFKENFMISKELLNILCCPETKQDIVPVEGDCIDAINKKIKEGTVKNRGGEVIREPIDGGLLRSDRQYLYPIREDIPIMLIDEAIPFKDFDV